MRILLQKVSTKWMSTRYKRLMYKFSQTVECDMYRVIREIRAYFIGKQAIYPPSYNSRKSGPFIRSLLKNWVKLLATLLYALSLQFQLDYVSHGP